MTEEQACRFQTTFTYDKATLKEISQSSPKFSPLFYITRTIFIATLLYFIIFLYGVLKAYTAYSEYYLLLGGMYFLIQLLMFFLRRNGGIQYKRMLSNNNGKPMHIHLHFDDTGIYTFNLDTENRNTYRYEQLRSLAQTKNYLVLLMEYNQFLLVKKDNLTGGTQNDFVDYLLSLCPKIKPRKIRSNRPGQIINVIMIAVLIFGLILAVYRLPLIQHYFDSKRPINNSMSYQQIADGLVSFGIQVDDASIAELTEFDDLYQNDPYYAEYYSDYSKVLDLLCYTGGGTYDEETWEWTPSTSGVYWFDTEVFNIETMYTDFLRGVCALNSQELNFTNIQEDTSKVNWEYGSGMQSATFHWNSHSYHLEGRVQYDWFDLSAADDLNKIIQTQVQDKQLYFVYDGGQGYLVLYGTKEWAKELEAATGLDLQTRASSVWNF